MIDFSLLERLLEMLDRTDAQTIEVRKGFFSTTVRVSKGGLASTDGAVTYQVAAGRSQAAPGVVPSSSPASPGVSGRAADAQLPVVPDKDLLEIKSPMVGTFYAQPEPGADPYVRVGSRIKPGQTLCIIEAMKIMNPLESEVSGVVEEVLAGDAQPVEFGQVLFRVDPNA